MLDVEEAVEAVLSRVRPVEAVTLRTAEALHRVLAEGIVCDVDYPPFDRSLMDGYAVRSADTAKVPTTLRVVGRIGAGREYSGRVGSGEAAQINTGAPIPSGADAVVRVESTELSASGNEVVVRESVEAGRWITPRGTYVKAGRTVLQAGDVLTPVNIGVAATAGAAFVRVYRRPRVAILVTGDELIDITEKPSGALIRNSNRYVLEALVRTAHCEPAVLPTTGDDRAALRSRITEGLSADVLCITGGVSMGAFDFVPGVLEELGSALHVRKMSIKPGRPTIFALSAEGKPIFALPGNPISALVGFYLLVVPALWALQGLGMKRSLMRARLRGELSATRDRQSYWPARMGVNADGEWEAWALSWHGSGDAIGMAGADGMIVQPPRGPALKDGDEVRVLRLTP